MPSAKEVTPGKWSDKKVLFDDGTYSVVWGTFNQEKRCLGVRWNGYGESAGYPSQGGKPLYYVEPDFLSVSILITVMSKLLSDTNLPDRDEFLDNVFEVLRELKK